MASIQQSIQIQADARAVFQRLARFEDYPQFMEDVESVEKTDEAHLHWTTKMANRPVEWDAEITELQSERCIVWHNISGPTNAGKVEVQDLGPNSSHLIFTLHSEPEQVPGSMAGYTEDELGQRLKRDLARFKDMMEGRSAAQDAGHSAPAPAVAQPDTASAASVSMRHVGDMPQDTTAERHGGVPTSDAMGKPTYPAVRDSMGGVYQAHDHQPAETAEADAGPLDSSATPATPPSNQPAAAGTSAAAGVAGGTDASAGAKFSGSKGEPGGASLRQQADAEGVPGTPGGELEGARISAAADADAGGGTGLGTAADAGDTRTGTGTTSGSGTALTGGGMSGGRDAGTSGKGTSS